MKRFLCFLFAVSLLTIRVFAYDLTYFEYDDGNTVLGTFVTSTLTESQKDDVRTFLDGENNLILYMPFEFENDWFYLINLDTASPPPEVAIRSDGLVDFYCPVSAIGTVWDIDESGNINYRFTTSITPGTEIVRVVIVGGKAVTGTNMTLPTPRNTYVADIVGALMLRDDGGLMSEPISDGEDSGSIFGFLSGFWDNLKDFFIGLFVPENDYFQKWYQSLKTAIDEKLSGISSLYDGLTSFFDSLRGSSEVIRFEIPANHFFVGSPAISADIFENLSSVISFIRGVLTGAVVLFTAIICYRKLVTIFSE